MSMNEPPIGAQARFGAWFVAFRARAGLRFARMQPAAQAMQDFLLKPLLIPRDRVLAPVLPAKSRSGAALMLVIAIMTFLAGLTAGAVHLVADASRDWSRAIAREMTIQVRPAPGRNLEADVAAAADL
ncbi:MAG: hypothetical protein ING86_15465, partial [Methylobacterium sp.]|nr:hypothetical protein [Methylobacterium sp.]